MHRHAQLSCVTHVQVDTMQDVTVVASVRNTELAQFHIEDTRKQATDAQKRQIRTCYGMKEVEIPCYHCPLICTSKLCT